ncbi:hypothetical protein Naga_100012g37 [Nannochloropsis gaditana]|uniref:Uncharacterized protein n=1 Tax=Nannochloropsis gaditana TaxID=72520 RepID=W7TLJ4_9STRA|nr:hypothetical protein Naga_100012g37 [Nannochloropsis gaditana]
MERLVRERVRARWLGEVKARQHERDLLAALEAEEMGAEGESGKRRGKKNKKKEKERKKKQEEAAKKREAALEKEREAAARQKALQEKVEADRRARLEQQRREAEEEKKKLEAALEVRRLEEEAKRRRALEEERERQQRGSDERQRLRHQPPQSLPKQAPQPQRQQGCKPVPHQQLRHPSSQPPRPLSSTSLAAGKQSPQQHPSGFGGAVSRSKKPLPGPHPHAQAAGARQGVSPAPAHRGPPRSPPHHLHAPRRASLPPTSRVPPGNAHLPQPPNKTRPAPAAPLSSGAWRHPFLPSCKQPRCRLRPHWPPVSPPALSERRRLALLPLQTPCGWREQAPLSSWHFSHAGGLSPGGWTLSAPPPPPSGDRLPRLPQHLKPPPGQPPLRSSPPGPSTRGRQATGFGASRGWGDARLSRHGHVDAALLQPVRLSAPGTCSQILQPMRGGRRPLGRDRSGRRRHRLIRCLLPFLPSPCPFPVGHAALASSDGRAWRPSPALEGRGSRQVLQPSSLRPQHSTTVRVCAPSARPPPFLHASGPSCLRTHVSPARTGTRPPRPAGRKGAARWAGGRRGGLGWEGRGDREGRWRRRRRRGSERVVRGEIRFLGHIVARARRGQGGSLCGRITGVAVLSQCYGQNQGASQIARARETGSRGQKRRNFEWTAFLPAASDWVTVLMAKLGTRPVGFFDFPPFHLTGSVFPPSSKSGSRAA